MKTTIIPNLPGRIQSVEIQEGETIEAKVARITQNKEPITDSAPSWISTLCILPGKFGMIVVFILL